MTLKILIHLNLKSTEAIWSMDPFNFVFKFPLPRRRLNLDVTWSETGDRYMLKLFRDYLFHTVTEDGRPWLNQSHIVQCLNKLDAGTLEKVGVYLFYTLDNLN